MRASWWRTVAQLAFVRYSRKQTSRGGDRLAMLTGGAPLAELGSNHECHSGLLIDHRARSAVLRASVAAKRIA
jgi:hypothetical protein